jgi:RNA recognition motif-containing protein
MRRQHTCRNKETGESRGFAFLAYEDQRSTNLAVDNLNGVSIDGRTIGVDHVKDYKRLVANPDAVHNPSAAPAAGASAAANSGRRPGGCLGQDHPPSDSPSPGSNRGT